MARHNIILVAEIIDIHIAHETAGRLRAAGCSRPRLIAARYTMGNGFYPERMARHGIEVAEPDEAGRAAIHNIIFDELCQGRIGERSKVT